MNKVIILLSSINKDNWTLVYNFINSIVNNNNKRLDTLDKIKKIASVRVTSKHIEDEVYSLCGQDISDSIMLSLSSKETLFSIIYLMKEDDNQDLMNLVPFVMLQIIFKQGMRSIVTLGINITELSLEDQNEFNFKCGDFLILTNKITPVKGKHSFYLIKKHATTNYLYASGIPAKVNSSRWFLPLLPINEENFKSIFVFSKNERKEVSIEQNLDSLNKREGEKTVDYTFIQDSIAKVKLDLINNKKIPKQIESEVLSIFDDSNSLLDIWLETVFINSLSKKELKEKTINYLQCLRNLLRLYKNSVFELIQNIMFHGGKNGLFYCAFVRKENISKETQSNIIDIDNYPDDARFLRIGIFDFGEKGIVETFKDDMRSSGKSADKTLCLNDFFDTMKMTTMDMTKLDMRYAARLGIKTFVKTIYSHKGFFSVESNDTIDGNIIKKRLTTKKEEAHLMLDNEIIYDYIKGTHYEIILPIIVKEDLRSQFLSFHRNTLLSDSLKEYLLSNNNFRYIKMINLNNIVGYDKIPTCDNKNTQIKLIEKVGKKILEKAEGENDIAIDMCNDDNVDPNIIFKISAYLQLYSKHNGFEKIIYINATDSFMVSFCEQIKNILINQDIKPVWSNESAIILLGNNLQAQIVCGKTKEEFFAFNKCLFNIFYSHRNFLSGSSDNVNVAQNFILPYDILVRNDSNATPFDRFVLKSLNSPIPINSLNSETQSEFGCLVNHKNTYIGNKIIVENYYEADTLFLNSTYAQRFAFLIASGIMKVFGQYTDKELVLIGYKNYSEYLLKAIKRLLTKVLLPEESIHIIIANEEKDTLDIDKIELDFDKRGNIYGETLKKRILQYPSIFKYATIVPVGSTLSTHDKIISFFKLSYNKKFGLDDSVKVDLHEQLNDNSFIYNHCLIIVRDQDVWSATELEMAFKWKEIDISNKIIKTEYNNAKKIHYSIMVANKDHHNWKKRLNNEISFPPNWLDEKYVNPTENSSINSQNLMGFPNVDCPDQEQHEIELERLFSLKDDIIKNEKKFNTTHKFYIDTETFVKRKNNSFEKWLKDIKTDNIFQQDKFNILIAPNTESESDLIDSVNEYIFNKNAMIIYLDVNNWRNNIIYKLAFLKNYYKESSGLDIKFHFVDQALLTANTYYKTKNYLLSILNDWNRTKPIFSSIITVINRLSYAKTQEIKNDIESAKLYTFVDIYYPSITYLDQKDELRKLEDYYKKLMTHTVLDNCLDVIDNNIKKLEIKKSETMTIPKKVHKRHFMRMVLTHELYYIISKSVENYRKERDDSVEDYVKHALDNVYDQFCNDGNYKLKDAFSKFNQMIEHQYSYYFDFPTDNDNFKYYCRKKITLDKKITFLKVISSPPLSKYIFVRDYAQNKLLNVLGTSLSDIINDRNPNKIVLYEDLRLIKSILKSLSFLKSNALVRKDVIIKTWRALTIIIEKLGNEVELLESLKKFAEDYISKNDLRVKIFKIILEEINSDLDHIKKDKELIIRDFSADMHFFIKNAIVEDEAKATYLGELLRTGDEITNFNFKKISPTKMYIQNKSANNSLFEYQFGNDGIFSKEYVSFLVGLFYDNTTIFRKTLENFTNELYKDRNIYLKFYDNFNDLKCFSMITHNIEEIENLYKEKINSEYYYYSFRIYSDNKDYEINYIRKLIYLTYAKLKLKDLNINKHLSGIEIDTKDLMEVFAAIMDADAAFFTMKKEYPQGTNYNSEIYPVSYIKKDEHDYPGWDFNKWFITNNFYTGEVLKQERDEYKNIYAPLIPIYNPYQFGEVKNLEYKHLGIYLVNDPKERNKILASISFLFSDKTFKTPEKFRINFQESGRLLLLLKPEINKYILGYLMKDKVFELWVQEHKLKMDLDKCIKNNDHMSNELVIMEMEIVENLFDYFNQRISEYEIKKKEIINDIVKKNGYNYFKKLIKASDDKTSDEYKELKKIFDEIETNRDRLKKLASLWFHYSNQVMIFLYYKIIRGENGGLNLGHPAIINLNTKIGDIFNDSFKSLISILLREKWSKKKYNTNIIMKTNKINIKMDPHLAKDSLAATNKYIMQSFIVQQLDNCLRKHCKDSYKLVTVVVEKNEIRIEESSTNSNENTGNSIKNRKRREYNKNRKSSIIKEFNWKREQIKNMNHHIFSSTTLTSLEGYIKNLNEHKYKSNLEYGCEYGYKEKGFILKITFKKL